MNFNRRNKMICGECIFAYTDLDDDEDIYSCPFFEYAYHSNEKCHYPKSYNNKLLSDCRLHDDLQHLQ